MKVLYSFLFFCCFSSLAMAGNLTISNKLSVIINFDSVICKIQVTNLGSESACDVFVKLFIFNNRYKSKTIPILEVHDTANFQFSVPLPVIAKGSYLAVVETFYDDITLSPNSSLTCHVFYVREAIQPNITVKVNDFVMLDDGDIVVSIKNNEKIEKKIKASVFAPIDFKVEPHSVIKQIPENSQEIILFNIERQKVGKEYQIAYYSAVEYDILDHHYTTLSKGHIKAKETDNWFRKNKWYWIIGFWMWIGLWCLCDFVHRYFCTKNCNRHH